ncbi:MAG: valine--tRNA ligase, partial [Cyclobacteriaceae bacterium]
MTLSSKYNPKEVEDKWYQHWLDHKFFHSEPNPEKEPFSIVIPPPNVTGVLHMGHMLNNTIQDVLIRKARMEGKEACWVPGTDHAAIATEAKVVGMLREKGIKKSDISRDEFLQHAWDWKAKYGDIIIDQLKKLGASCDWDRTRFTMEPKLSQSVVKVFVEMYRNKYIYRGLKMVNWDPKAQTTISNEEVIYKEVTSKLYYVKYQVVGSDEWVTVATTRPETILGDTAVCIHPKDERYQHLKGKQVIIPMVNRQVPIIEDPYVDREFGTGCLKVTPAHDANDYELGQKHNLETVDIFNNDGTLSEVANHYVGKDRFEARKLIVIDLKNTDQLLKVEEIENNLGYSERNPDVVVEPKLSLQWFVHMEQIAKPALENVMNDQIRFFPVKFKNVYKHWLENIRDWPISRQLWWGQQIPAYYYGEEGVAVAETIEEALSIARKDSGNNQLQTTDLTQDEDVVDTWFSSWLWPIAVFDGILEPENKDITFYYPTSVLVTGWDIIFFWVARMIFAGYEFRHEKPFEKVYFTGMVRDSQKRKMSKSLGNSPDSMALIDQYGADGVRTGMLFSAPAGNDLLFDEKLCEQGRNFANKIWNAFRLVQGWEVDEKLDSAPNETARTWFDHRMNQGLEELEDHFTKFRISDALMTLYKLIWDDFCSWYLEMVKPAYESPIDATTYRATLSYFEEIVKVLHPFMPFITEELWHALKERDKQDCVMVAPWPQATTYDAQLLDQTQYMFEVITQLRNLRNSKGLPKKELISLSIKTKQEEVFNRFEQIIKKLSNVETLSFVESKVDGAATFAVKRDEFYVPLEGAIDPIKEREQITKELEYIEGSLRIANKKLENSRFVENAPETVVASERQKKADAEA